MKQHLTAADLMSDESIEPVLVSKVPGFGDTPAYIASLTADERDEMEELWRDYRDEDSTIGFRSFVVAYCISDPIGNRLFKLSADIIKAARHLGTKRKAVGISRLFNVACATNGLLKEDVEALEKNSEPSPPASGN